MTKLTSRLDFFLLLMAVVLVGCQSSTNPGQDSSAVYGFSPAAGPVILLPGANLDFVVTADGGKDFSAEWTLDGQVVSQTATFQFQTGVVGTYLVEVTLVAGGQTESQQWNVEVVNDQSLLPPVVGSVELDDGSGPGDVRLAWNAVGGSHFPVVSYEIGCSFTGSLSEDNWEQADIRISEPASTGIGYVRVLTPDDGMIPGRHVWIGVRAQDDQGQLSPLPNSFAHLISFPWTLEGRVQDDFGQGLASVILRLQVAGQEQTTATSGSDGLFQFSGLSSVDSVRVVALAIDPGFYSFRTPSLYSTTATSLYNITLIRKYGADATCNSNGGDFLSYLRFMTRSGEQHGGILHKWDSYPIKVFVPVFVRDDGVDFGDICRQAMNYWNTDSGLDLFTETAVESDADVLVTFTAISPGLNGQVVLLAPQGTLGAVTPQSMRMDIDRDLTGNAGVDVNLALKGVCLHEFGHVMGLYEHSNCAGYRLMNSGNGTFAFKPETEQPIADDEHNAARCLRFLGDGVDMNAYGNN